MSSLTALPYQSLAGRTECFRLLKILPGKARDPIRCSLSVQSISSRSFDYITGSYVWGPPENPGVIYVDHQPFHIRRRLSNFLHCLRQQGAGAAVEVWIDAICINQEDSEEKAQQIRMMSTIYTKSEKTIAWLDEADQEIHLAFDVIQRRARETRSWYGGHVSSVKEMTPPEWQAVIKLIKHQHFTRRWIVQETMLPVTITLQCGDRSLPWTLVETFLSTLRGWECEARWLQIDQSIFRRLWTDRSKLHEHHGGLRLQDLLRRYKDTVCKKKCDEVNAFLGLVDNGKAQYCDDDSTELLASLLGKERRFTI